MIFTEIGRFLSVMVNSIIKHVNCNLFIFRNNITLQNLGKEIKNREWAEGCDHNNGEKGGRVDLPVEKKYGITSVKTDVMPSGVHKTSRIVVSLSCGLVPSLSADN